MIDVGQLLCRVEKVGFELISVFFDFYGVMWDVVIEVVFFVIYVNMFLFYLVDRYKVEEGMVQIVGDLCELLFVKEVLELIVKGGYIEVFVCVVFLFLCKGELLLLWWLVM